MATLRNEVISATSADMQRRGEDVAHCFADADLVGEQKVRFAVDVTSNPRDATIAAWRFVEIVDGEPLPETFATCAERALGGGLRVVAPPGFEFPTYHGQVSILYRLPATSADKS